MIALPQAPTTTHPLSLSLRYGKPMERDDRSYYQHRLARSLELAELSNCSAARSAHEGLARLYREKLYALGGARKERQS